MKHTRPEIHRDKHNHASFDIAQTRLLTPVYNNSDFFHLLAENARDLIFHSTVSPTYKFDYVSPSSTRIIGYTPEEFYADPFLAKKCIPPEDFTLLSDTSRWQDPRNIKPLEIRWKCKDGRIIWTEHMISPLLGKDGSPEGFNIIARDITERKKMETALRESEEKFSKAFQSSPQVIAITTVPEGRFIEVNDSYTLHTGYAREEIIGRKTTELNVWADDKDRRRMLDLAEKHGKVNNKEFKFRTKSGETRTWLFSAEPITVGGSACLIGVATDITERKTMEEELRESEEKFSKAFNASPESIAITTVKEGRYIDVNESYLRRTGYTREELIGKTTADIRIWANEEDRARMHKMAQEKGRVYNEEFEFRMKSGEIRTSLVSLEPITIKGEPCLIGVSLDITPRKRIENALRESEEKFSVAFRSSPDIMAIVSLRDGTYTEVNDSYINYLGYAREELIGHTAGELNIWVYPQEVERMIKALQDTGKIREAEHSVRSKNGEIHTWLCSADIISINGEGYMLAASTDITRQKEAEAKLQEHKKMIESILAATPEGVLVIDGKGGILLANKALQKIFRFNGRSLKNKTLTDIFPREQFYDLHRAVKGREAEKKTLEFRYRVQEIEKIIGCVVVKMDGERTLLTFSDISREREEEEKLYLTDRLASIGEMAAGLAHELNNPLTGILALSQMLMHGNLTSEHREDLECINTEAKRAAGIVKNVLLFARNKTGENSQCSVNEAVKTVLKLREFEERMTNITVVSNLEENLPPVPVDQWQMQQVFLNLISNAEAAIKEVNRPGIITIGTQQIGNHVNIVFSDNGCGINKQIMPRIFDPFFTTKEIGKGTGLGLSICYSIIVKHGGKIAVKSQVNEGTTFTIKIPVVQ